MKKIGILTYYWSDNPGTFLQAYSTLKVFQQVFSNATVELIGCQHGKLKVHINRKAAYIFPLFKELKRYYIYRKYQADYLNISANSVLTDRTDEAAEYLKRQQYDMIVVGADTVLQLLAVNRKEGNLPIYWLPPDIPSQKAACATSCGSLTFEELSESQRAYCRESLNKFKLLGVRDDATLDLFCKLRLDNEQRIVKVPDPTFAYSIDHSLAESYIKKQKLNSSRPILAILTQKTFQFARELSDYYRNKGYLIVTLAPLSCGDICIRDISPFEWAGLFKYFSLVVTDRFHGTVFSLKNGTPVVSVACEQRKLTAQGQTKTKSLLETFNLGRTNYINTIGMHDYNELQAGIDAALAAFEPDAVALGVRELGDNYVEFVKRIKEVF
jgi:polysaccharide pyruvyl transferase WcaK-like protein